MSVRDTSWLDGLKKTKQREMIYRVLQDAKHPLSAIEICAEIEKTGEQAWPSTVYRVLDSFEKKNLVEKVATTNGGMALYERKRDQHRHYAVCLHCRKTFPLNACPIEEFLPILKQDGFQVTGHNIELYGFCKDCVEDARARGESIGTACNDEHRHD